MHVHLSGARVPGDVGEGFLQDAEDVGGTLDIEGNRVRRQVERTSDAGTAGELVHGPLDRGDEPEVVQHGGAEVRGERAHLVHHLVDQCRHTLRLGPERFAQRRRHAVLEGEQIHLERRQGLAQLVVDLSRDLGALRLAGRAEPPGKGPQLGARACQGFGHVPPLGDVPGDGRGADDLAGGIFDRRHAHRHIHAAAVPA